MHRRIDQLTDEETVLDLFETMNSFLDGRVPDFAGDSPEVMAQLAATLAKIDAGQRGISTDELKDRMQQWRTH